MKTYLITALLIFTFQFSIAQNTVSESAKEERQDIPKSHRSKFKNIDMQAVTLFDQNRFEDALSLLGACPEYAQSYRHAFLLGYAQHQSYLFEEAITNYQVYLQELDNDSEEYDYVVHLLNQAKNGLQNQAISDKSVLSFLDIQVESNLMQKYLMLHPVSNNVYYSSHHGKKKDPVQTFALNQKASFGMETLLLDFSFGLYFRTVQFFDFGKALLLLNVQDNALYESRLQANQWTAPSKMVSSSEGQCISSATIDNKGENIIVAQVQEDGSMDLLSTHKVADEWSELATININTDQQECFPQLTADGQTLFFSSSGHASIGGFDIFYCTWDAVSNQWSKPINMGFPLNTPADDLQFAINADGTSGVLLSDRNIENQIVTFEIIPEFKTQR